jgi:4-aminobutyrate aminotransferase
MLARADLADAWPPAAQGTTFGGNPIACRAGSATLRIIQEEDLMARAVEVGDYIQDRFREAQEELPVIGDVRGKGLMVGVELVNADGSPAGEVVKAVMKDSRAGGIVLTKCGASTLRFAPPLIITQEQAGKGVDVIIEIVGRHQW